MHLRLSDHSVAFSGKLNTKYFQLCFRNVHVCYEFLCLHVPIIRDSPGATSYTRRQDSVTLSTVMAVRMALKLTNAGSWVRVFL